MVPQVTEDERVYIDRSHSVAAVGLVSKQTCLCHSAAGSLLFVEFEAVTRSCLGIAIHQAKKRSGCKDNL
jgi:hypothetical protein